MLFFLYASLVSAEVPTKIPPDKERGESLYYELCSSCHGEKALGDSDTAAQLGYPEPALSLAGKLKTDAFQSGVKTIQYGRGLMPAYEQQIDKHESKRILIWLESIDPIVGATRQIESEDEEAEKTVDKKEPKEGDSEAFAPVLTPSEGPINTLVPVEASPSEDSNKPPEDLIEASD